MKKIISLLLFTFTALTTLAQNDEIDFSKVKAPQSPAFSILGVLPNEIDRPKTYKDLETSLLSNFTDGENFVIPENYALEFSPYWMRSNPMLTYEGAVNPSAGQSFLQNLAFSVANSQQASLADTSKVNARMGIGIRSRIDFGEVKAEGIKAFYLLDAAQNLISSVNFQLRTLEQAAAGNATEAQNKALSNKVELANYLMSELDVTLNGINISEEAKKDLRKLILNRINTAIAGIQEGVSLTSSNINKVKEEINALANGDFMVNLAKNLEDENTEVQGFFVEFAGAMVLDFPKNTFEFSTVPKYAFWITPGYKLDKVELMGFYRIMWQDQFGLSALNNDFGARAVYSWKQFSLSLEYIQRFQSSDVDRVVIDNVTYVASNNAQDYKLNGTFEYRINSKFSLNYTIGRGFTINTFNNSALNMIAGINYGFGGWTSDTELNTAIQE